MKIDAKEIIKPTSILVVVAGIFTALVVGTNGLTEEKIAILNQQNELYRQQQQALHVLAEQLRAQLAMMAQGTQEAIELQREINKLSTEWWNLESAIVSNNNTVNDYYENQREEAEQ